MDELQVENTQEHYRLRRVPERQNIDSEISTLSRREPELEEKQGGKNCRDNRKLKANN